MPIRIGEVFLFVFFVLVLYVSLADRARVKGASQDAAADRKASVQTVVSETGPATIPAQPGIEQGPADHRQPTGKKANVAGIWGTFECVEYRANGLLEVHVRQIDEHGRQLAPSSVHQESFDDVIDTYTAVTAW